MVNSVQIFCFHRISDEFSPSYPPIPVHVFAKILAFIQKHYYVVPIEDLNIHSPTQKPKLIITFDDAYYDFYENALPLLYKYKFPAVQHVITHSAETGESFWTQKLNKIVDAYFFNKQKLEIPELSISCFIKSAKEAESMALKIYLSLLNHAHQRNDIIKNLEHNLKEQISYTRMMNWKELHESTKYGIAIGSHTHTHATLTTLNEQELIFELQHSRDLITKNISGTCLSLAFPNGMYNHQVIETAIESGYRYLLGTDNASTTIRENAYLLPRISLYNNVWWKNKLKLLNYRYNFLR